MRAIAPSSPIAALRQALYDVAPVRPLAGPAPRVERRRADRRQLLTASPPALERRVLDRRADDRADDRAGGRAGPAVRKGLLIDIYV